MLKLDFKILIFFLNLIFKLKFFYVKKIMNILFKITYFKNEILKSSKKYFLYFYMTDKDI